MPRWMIVIFFFQVYDLISCSATPLATVDNKVRYNKDGEGEMELELTREIRECQ